MSNRGRSSEMSNFAFVLPTTPTISLLTLSDELLLTIIHNLDRHTDIPCTRLVCRKLNDLTETYFYRNVMLTLPEQVLQHQWQLKLYLMPPQVLKTKQFTILNQRRIPGGYFYAGTICQPHSYRILRWNLLEDYAADANREFARAACLAGVQFYPSMGKFAKRQLTAFRWRHAMPLSLTNLTSILDKQARTLQELEISMLLPPAADQVRKFRSAIKHKKFLKLRSFKYHGLSHTEPLPVNRPEKGGRCRMLRPLFQLFHQILEELVLSQDHCISQVGKTPMTLGRTIMDTLCHLDDLYIDPPRSTTAVTDEQPSITLKLTKLELGGFRISSLFDVPTSPMASPRVMVHLPSIRRLVLNNCFGLEGFLRKMYARRDEIQNLTEFGVRIEEDDEYPDGLSDVFEALRDFLLCFKGLEVLSVLVDGDASELRVGKDVLLHHACTLQVYSVAARNHDDGDDDDNTLRFVSVPTYGKFERDEINPGCMASPPALREYGTFLNRIIGGEYARLRYLSQFPDLRTVVIRNFPPLSPDLKEVDNKYGEFWRVRQGNVDDETAVKMAETFAEQIALPFYALPSSYIFSDDDSQDDSLPYPGGFVDDENDFDIAEEDARIRRELEEIAAVHHTTSRDSLLGFTLRPHSSSPTPKTDPTHDVLKQKAQVDSGFRDVMRKVEQGVASLYEKDAFDRYQASVQVALGVRPPPDETMPKLRLLVVGDWSYRDQMNISGPRRWDPTAWSYKNGDHAPVPPHSGVSDHSIEDYDTWNYKTYRLRAGFKKEFDVSLLPIFFAIDWAITNDKERGRWRWKATATVLNQDTLEGQGALGDTKLLDFAWMN